MREKVTPGTSALFALTSGATEDRVIEELKQYEFEIISTNLPAEQEQRLREAFGEEPYDEVAAGRTSAPREIAQALVMVRRAGASHNAGSHAASGHLPEGAHGI